MKLFMYNTATNWCKLFLSSKQEFYYPVRVSSEFFFWVHRPPTKTFHSVEMLSRSDEQISDHINRCLLAARQNLYIIKLSV